MGNHQELVKIITNELYNDDRVLALMLYGSVSRGEEGTNSDIDLLVLVSDKHCQKRHVVRCGIMVEYLEMHVEYLRNFISENEIPVLFTLIEGTILFDKQSLFDCFIADAKDVIENGPPVNVKWENDRYATKKRSDITEIYMDMLDAKDEVVFNYLVSSLITTAIPLLNENYNLWPKTRKKQMQYLKSHCYDGYKYMEILLDSMCSIIEKCDAAKNLINYTLKKHGGLLTGDAVIFKF